MNLNFIARSKNVIIEIISNILERLINQVSFFFCAFKKEGSEKDLREYEAIDYLDKLEVGNYLTVNILLIGDDKIPVTAMYLGKDKTGKYNFADSGIFVFSKEFIEKGKISFDKEYDGDKALEIHARIRKEQEKNFKKAKNNDAR